MITVNTRRDETKKGYLSQAPLLLRFVGIVRELDTGTESNESRSDVWR